MENDGPNALSGEFTLAAYFREVQEYLENLAVIDVSGPAMWDAPVSRAVLKDTYGKMEEALDEARAAIGESRYSELTG